jgi:hypothetical protein
MKGISFTRKTGPPRPSPNLVIKRKMSAFPLVKSRLSPLHGYCNDSPARWGAKKRAGQSNWAGPIAEE